MIAWKNTDTLASYQELLNAERVELVSAMSGENGAERVKAYTVPMGEDMDFNFAARPVNDDILAKLAATIAFDPAYQPFGDGHSADRIVEKIQEYLE